MEPRPWDPQSQWAVEAGYPRVADTAQDPNTVVAEVRNFVGAVRNSVLEVEADIPAVEAGVRASAQGSRVPWRENWVSLDDGEPRAQWAPEGSLLPERV